MTYDIVEIDVGVENLTCCLLSVKNVKLAGMNVYDLGPTQRGWLNSRCRVYVVWYHSMPQKPTKWPRYNQSLNSFPSISVYGRSLKKRKSGKGAQKALKINCYVGSHIKLFCRATHHVSQRGTR